MEGEWKMQEPNSLGQQSSTQISQWLFPTSRRGQMRTFGAFASVIILVAVVVVGLLALSSAFFPQ